ncbi:MAG: hypothetical protein ACRDFW_02425 [bacterium]
MNFPKGVTEAIVLVQDICAELGVDVVVVGAVAYGAWLEDPWRSTSDVDVAVALDLDDLQELKSRLTTAGFERDPQQEHRWYAPNHVPVDFILAGPKLRESKEIRWPETGTVMSLLGFEHVFREAVAFEVRPGRTIKIVSLPVYALLKIAAYFDRPEAGRDVRDIASLLERYEKESDLRFSTPVLDAGVTFQEAGAYLLGLDLGNLCSADEADLVERFIQMATDRDSRGYTQLVKLAPSILGDDKETAVVAQIDAFGRGFHESRKAHSNPTRT